MIGSSLPRVTINRHLLMSSSEHHLLIFPIAFYIQRRNSKPSRSAALRRCGVNEDFFANAVNSPTTYVQICANHRRPALFTTFLEAVV